MRYAASMIELVIAIVVMGIAMMSLPLMLTQTKSNNEFAMQQEAILATRTKLGDILTYAWDEQNANQTEVSFVLDTNDTGSDTELDKNSTSRRIGHVVADKRRKGADIFFQSTVHTALGADTGETLATFNDIDDFHGTTQQLFDTGNTATTGFDYKFTDINLSTVVLYIADNANYNGQTITNFILGTTNANRRSNIKMVQVTVSGAQNNFVLRSYSSNIGESELLRRNW